MTNPANHLPHQVIGKETNFTHERQFESVKDAHEAYKIAAERLLNVNNWDKFAGMGSAKFTLCNNLGNELNGFVNQGFYLKVDLPGLGSDAGDGSEWVMIENAKAEGDAHTAEEYVLFTARPAPDPRKADATIAHFFTDQSTSTFIVRRDGRVVSAGAHGRNETPNNESVDLHDKVRNTVIALMARTGLSGGQWQKLVNGLIECK